MRNQQGACLGFSHYAQNVQSNSTGPYVIFTQIKQWKGQSNLAIALLTLNKCTLLQFLHCWFRHVFVTFPTDICSFKVNIRNTSKQANTICSNLVIKIPERHRWPCSVFFVVNFEQIAHIFLVLSWLIYRQTYAFPIVRIGFTAKL